MKTLIIFLLASCLALSQTREPEQAQINLFGTPNYLSDDIDYFKLDEFIFGWHWGSMLKIGEATHSNMNDMSTEYGFKSIQADSFNLNSNLFLRASYQLNSGNTTYPIWTHASYDRSIMFTKSMSYSAALEILPGDSLTLNPLANDSQKHVFGFKTKDANCTNVFDSGIWRLKVEQSQVDSNTVILADPFPNNFLTYKASHTTVDTIINRDWSGRRYYLSINLRRTGENEVLDDKPVLEIEVPYLFQVNDSTFTTGTVTFDSIPSNINSDFYSLPNNRGNAWRLIYAGINGTKKLIITRKMLPLTSDDYGDITISGFIDFGRPNPNKNELLHSSFDSDADNKIHELDIKVTYKGNCDVEINWLKFETTNTRWLTHGYRDSLILRGIQRDVDSLTQSSYLARGVKLKRFTINVEPSAVNWASERYFTKLIGNLITGSHPPYLPLHYDYHIGPPDRWMSFYSFKRTLSAPFCESNRIAKDTNAFLRNGINVYNENLWQTLGIRQGYKYHPHPSNHDTINPFKSEYETFLRSGDSVASMRIATFEDYKEGGNVRFVDSECSIQSFWEWNLYLHYYDKLRTGFQYSEKPWYSQSFIIGEWGLTHIYDRMNPSQDTFATALTQNIRTTTSEEYRLMAWSGLLQGAKGLFYDGDVDSKSGNMYLKLAIHETELSLNAQSKSGLEYLELDELGGDFLGIGTDHLNLYDRIYDIDSVANYMGTRSDRFYTGKKSKRIEMRRLHEWVLNNEDFIMSQRLQAWFGCGYKIWENRHPRWGETDIMRKFINVDSIKTRKLYAVDSTGYSPSTGYEPNTDNFLDITILANKNDTNMTNGFTVGIQNRRTDPLIYFTEDTLDKHILFLSSNEFEQLCENGGVNPMRPLGDSYPDTLWQKYYLKKFGIREITIPFNYCDTTNNGSEYTLLRVTELKADNAYDDEWSWWQKERYHNYIDTVIGQNSPLAIKFLPGEGKMLKVEILRPNPIAGNLAYSNQSKMVVYPVYVDGEPTDAVRYHTTYHKKDPDRHDLMTVYYRRSLPRHIDSLNKQIIWEPEIKVSDTIVVKLENEPVVIEEIPAYYPSIVVRNDGNTPKAYVVFHTEAENVYICDDPICDPAENPCRDYLNPICETILDVNGTLASVISKGIAIHQINHGHSDEWGTPVVNASAHGNYYAWADSLCGIGVGFKAPDQEYLQDFTHLRFGYSDYEANHPSLNVYSAIDFNEGECSLVWQEKNDFGKSIIYYTKLLYESPYITNYLAESISNSSEDIQNEILRLSSNFESGRFPSIYRAMSDMGDSIEIRQRESIVWETKTSTEYMDIAMMGITHVFSDTINQYDFASVYNIRKIYGYSKLFSSFHHKLTNPTLSQASSFEINKGMSPYIKPNSFLLNFVDNWTELSSSGKKIYHLMIPNVAFVNSQGLSIKDYNKTIYPVSEGMYPHLALSPYANNSTNIWKNHRIYENGTLDGNPKIVPNPAYFYPFSECPDCQKSIINIGYGGNSPISFHKISNLKLTLPDMQSAPVPMQLPYVMVDTTDDYIEFTPRDTLYSEWWHLDSTAEFQYLVTFNDTNVVTLKLQKLSDSSFIDLPAPYLPGSGFSFMVFYLVNGSNDDYRLAMINNQPSFCDYTEDLYFADQFVVDSVYAKGTYREIKNNVINLNPNSSSDKLFKLVCHPNPAKDELNISVYSEQKKLVSESVSIGIYNQQGIQIMELSSGINTTTIIPISNLMMGVYFIRANLSTTESTFSDVQKVLIVK